MTSRTAEKETKFLESALKERPDSLLFARLADAYRKEGNISQAIELCTNGLKYFPDYTTGRILLGRCYLEQQNLSEATNAFTKVCSGDRRNQVAIKMLADIFLQQGMQQKAGDLYTLLYIMDPDNVSLKQLCSQYTPSGANDLFSILGISAASGQIPTAKHGTTIETHEQIIEEPVAPSLYAYTDATAPQAAPDEFGELFASVRNEGATENGGFSGTDVVDRLSSLFGGPNPQELPAGQPAGQDSAISLSTTDAPDSDGPAISAKLLDGSDVSGDDVSDRIGEMFTGNHASGLMEPKPKTPESGNLENLEFPEPPVESLAEQDFDFSGLVQNQTLPEEPSGEATFTDNTSDILSDDMTIGESMLGNDTVAAPEVMDSAVPDFDIDYLSEQPQHASEDSAVAGTDISSRLDDIFSTEQPDTPASSADDVSVVSEAMTASENHGIEEDAATILKTDLAADQSIAPEGFDEMLPFEEQTVIISKSTDLPGEPYTPADTADSISGDDAPDRLESFFPQEPSLDNEQQMAGPEVNESLQEEAFDTFGLQANELFTTGEPSSHPEPESDQQASAEVTLPDQDDLNGLDIQNRISEIFDNDTLSEIPGSVVEEPSGDDIVSRLDDLFDSLPGKKEAHPAPNQVSSDSDVSFSLDSIITGTEELDQLPPLPESEFAADINSFSSQEQLQGHDADVNTGFSGATIDDDVLSPEDSEGDTVKQSFSDQLHTDEDAFQELFAETAVSGAVQTDDSTDKDSFTPPDFAETLQFDSALFEKMLNPEMNEPQNSDIISDKGNFQIQLDSEAADSSEPQPDLYMDDSAGGIIPQHMEPSEPVNDLSLPSSSLITEELFIDETTPSDNLLSEAADFSPSEELPGSTIIDDSESSPDLILDSSDLSEAAPHTDIISSFVNHIVSDNTEILDIAPNGDDIVGKLDSMFSEDGKQKTSEKTLRQQSDEFTDLTQEYLLDDLSDMGEEEDAALIETMQIITEPVSSNGTPPRNKGPKSDENDTYVSSASVDVSTSTEDEQMPVVSGSDIADRIESFFPTSDLMTLSSGKGLHQEEDADNSSDVISDFYTISGLDAAKSTDEPLPETLDQVEPAASETIAEDQPAKLPGENINTPVFPKRQTTFIDEMLPGGEPFEDFPQETIEMKSSDLHAISMPVPDNRDRPFDIPDHVITPTLADIYFQQGQYRLALQIFSRLLAHDPDNVRLLNRYNEIKSIVEHGEASSDNEKTAAFKKNNESLTCRKKNIQTPKNTGPEADMRPLAGVHLKKRTIKTTRKISRKKDH